MRQAETPAITVTELPNPEGYGPTPFAINEAGQVAATGNIPRDPGTLIESLLYADGRWTAVSPPATEPFFSSIARVTVLNERGDVGGSVSSSDGTGGPATYGGFAWVDGRLALAPIHPEMPDPRVADMNERRQVLFPDRVWQDGAFTVVPTPPGATGVTLESLNDAGQTAGTLRRPPATPGSRDAQEVVRWRIGGGITSLGAVPRDWSTHVAAVNDAGTVVSQGHSPTFLDVMRLDRVWVWRDGRRIDLGTLGGLFYTRLADWPAADHAVNARGEVVGTSQTASGEGHAFYWRGGRLIDLGTLNGGTSEAVAVNDRGQVVGLSRNATDGERVFLWQNGRMIDLTALVPGPGTFDRVYDINNRGQIVGTAWDQESRRTRVLVVTVPPPPA